MYKLTGIAAVSAALLQAGCTVPAGEAGHRTLPNQMHSSLGQWAADLASLIRPTLTVVDAVRIPVEGGPTGGSLNDVQETNAVIAHIKAVADMGLEAIDLSSVKVEEINA